MCFTNFVEFQLFAEKLVQSITIVSLSLVEVLFTILIPSSEGVMLKSAAWLDTQICVQ
jgi:hypothetical protein